MNIYKYSFKSFRQNMGKGIIFMITLSILLMVSILNIATSIQNTTYQETVAINTNAHVKFNYVTEEQASIISKDESVLWSNLRMNLKSWGIIPDSDNAIGIMSWENLEIIEGIDLASGKAPQEEFEVALTAYTAKALGVNPKPLEKFTLTIEDIDGTTSEYTMVISGILREMKYYSAFEQHVICVSKSFMEAHGKFPTTYGEEVEMSRNFDHRELYVHFKDNHSIEENVKHLAEVADIEDNISLSTLAKLNMNRNGSRTISTILALSISGILFLCVSTLGFSLFESIDNLIKDKLAGDITIFAGTKYHNIYTYPLKNQLTDDVIDAVSKINGIKELDAFSTQIYCTNPSDLSNGLTGSINGVDHKVFSNLMNSISEGNPTIKELSSKDNTINIIAINDSSYHAEYSYKLGDTITAYLVDMVNNSVIPENTITFKIVGVIDSNDITPYVMTMRTWMRHLPSFIMPQDLYNQLGFEEGYKSASLSIDEEKHDDIMFSLKAMCSEYDEIYSESMLNIKREYQRQIISIIALILLAVLIIALIGILNLISSVFISIEQRKKEFGILSALGLSKKNIQKLLSYESIRISTISILLSTTLGLGIGYLIYKLLNNIGISYLEFSFPTIPLIFLCTLYTILPLIITEVSSKKLLNYTTTELLGETD